MKKIAMRPLCLAVACSANFSGAVMAQSAIEEVVVTARKQSESLQEVPLSITPISGEALEKQGFNNLADVASATPGLSYMEGATSGYQGSATIRGLAQGFLQDRVQNVAIFIDGVYLQRQSMANVGMVDMERIEVVKGPQNALYGHNAFAGAINYVTKKPTDELEAYVSLGVGPNSLQEERGTISGPIIEDKLLGRASFGLSYYDGHTENPHPYAKVNTPGYSAGGDDGMLGGWDDETYNLGLTFRPSDTLQFNTSYYRSDLQREEQPRYVINGAMMVAGNQAGPFADMNYNTQPVATVRRNSGTHDSFVYAPTLWKGALPQTPSPGYYVPIYDAATWNQFGTLQLADQSDMGYGDPLTDPSVLNTPDPVIPGMADPRNIGFLATSDVVTLSADWDINEDWSTNYTFGWIDHEGYTIGSAERDPLWGWVYNDITTSPENPQDKWIQVNGFSGRPIIEQKVNSHELRFDFKGSDSFSASFGAYYAETKDQQYDLTMFAPPCTTNVVDQDVADGKAGCTGGITNGMTQASGSGINVWFGDQWNGAEASKTQYEDSIRSVFGMLEYYVSEDVSLRVEARYTEEDKTIERLTDLWGLEPGELGQPTGTVTGVINFPSKLCAPGTNEIYNPGRKDEFGNPDPGPEACIPTTDERTFYYFTPKAGIDWNVSDDNFLYAYVANGLKAGGFNNTIATSQATFEAEENWTYEVGSKNKFLDGRVQFNASLYYIDWLDMQGKETPKAAETVGTNVNSAIGNIGDVQNYGMELEGIWQVTDHLGLNLGYAYTNPKFDDDVKYDAAQRNWYYQCTQENLLTDTNVDGTPIGGNFDGVIDAGELCGNTDVGGNTLDRVSKHQGNWAANYLYDFDSGWSLTARLDGNYQSKQYMDPMNLAYIKSRTVWNSSVSLLAPEHWEFNLWGKNIFDKEYVTGGFVTANFNQYMIAYGAGPTYGLTVKYNF